MTEFKFPKLKFSKWAKWDKRTSQLNDDLKHPGIYALRISEYPSLEGQEFEWHKDIVYIGMTNSVAGLKGRLTQFNNTLRDKSGGGHGGADRFKNDEKDGDALANKLYVSVCKFPNPYPRDSVQNLRERGRVAMAEYVAFAEYVEQFEDGLPKYNNMKASPKLSKFKKANSPP